MRRVDQIVAVPRSEEVRFADLATSRGVPVVRIGVTSDVCVPGAGAGVGASAPHDGDHSHEPAVELQGLFTLPLEEARTAFLGTLPAHFG